MSPPGDRREPPADTKCPPAAQRKQAKRDCINNISKIHLKIKQLKKQPKFKYNPSYLVLSRSVNTH